MFKKITSMALLLLSFSVFTYAQQGVQKEEAAGISARLDQEINMTKDPALGYVPKGRLFDAYTDRQQKIQNRNSLAPTFTWTERGPNSDVVGPSNGNSRPGNGVTSGRMRAIWEDLGDATGKTVWVGGIDGGLWKTNDITAIPASWTPINDFLGNLAVSSICQDPTDVNIMYFGTGEKAINADAVRGAGLWTSTDHGVTWTLMPGSSNFWNVSKVVCDAAGNLYVGCNSTSNNSGIQRYTKATSTWTNITPSGLAARIPDMVISSTGRLHIVCGYFNTAAASAGYRYTDNPATVTTTGWTSPAVSFTPVNVNVTLAVSGNNLYALPSNTSYQVATIYKSTNGGANWAATATTPAFTSGQGWYCMGVAIDPNNANNVIVGSLDCYKTTNGGTSWTKISNWVGTTGQYVHADQQIITWRNNNQVLVGSDGGIHYSGNGGTTFQDKNTGLRIKQFYSVAVHPTSTNYFLAGAQDNGTHQLNGAGLTSSVEVTGGDGAFTAIDQNQPQYQFGAYVYNQYRRSTNSGGAWTSINYSSTAGRFINPFAYDNTNNILYASGVANAFVRWSNPQTGSTFASVSMTALGAGTVSNVKVSPFTNNTVYFGGGGSGVTPTLIRAANANATPTFTNIIGSGMQVTGTNISSIEFGTTENNIIVSVSNYGVSNVWVTSNGGTTWTAIDGDLPDMPVRWAMFYPGSNTSAIIATETGVWQTDNINGAATLWGPETGFPNVRTDMLQYRSSDGLLAAATHGRGIFTTIIGAAADTEPPSAPVLSATGTTSNTISLSWTAATDNVGVTGYDVYVNGTLNGSTTTALTYVVTGLAPATLYSIYVRAKDAAGNGTNSNTINPTTQTAGDTQPPTAPVLSSTGSTASTIGLSWTAATDNVGVTGYEVYVNGTLNGTTTTALTYTVSGLAASTAYSIYVRAKDAAGNGTNSNTINVSTQAAGGATTIFAHYFETGWDGWADGGSDVARYSGTRSYEGSWSIYIRDNSGLASAMTSSAYNVSAYNQLTIDFYFYATSMEAGEDFWVQYYNGSTWSTVATYVSGTSFNNNGFYHATINLTNVNFPTNAQFRFQCDASDNSDLIYIDQVTVTGSNTASQSNSNQSCELMAISRAGLDATALDNYLMVYPVPATNELTVSTAEIVKAVKMYSMNGTLVKQLGAMRSGNKIDISDLTPGVYIAAFVTEEETITRKFIKK
ncbi:MAG: fibronectin type III domain-containing protein [Chitinophagaceae bacterium]|nr:fibronectin type III domain-containing protein [Chitinophagaceae bacterium]